MKRTHLPTLAALILTVAACGASTRPTPPVLQSDDGGDATTKAKTPAKKLPSTSTAPTSDPSPVAESAATATAATDAPADPVTAVAAPQAVSLQQVYRLFGPDHLFSLNANDSAPVYRNEGLAFKTFRDPLNDSVVLQRCLAGGAHFISTDEHCEGQVHDGGFVTIGAIATKQLPHTVALFRCSSPNAKDWLVVINRTECDTLRWPATALGWAPVDGFTSP